MFSFSNSPLLPFQQTTVTYQLSVAQQNAMISAGSNRVALELHINSTSTTPFAFLGTNELIWTYRYGDLYNKISSQGLWDRLRPVVTIPANPSSPLNINIPTIAFPFTGTFFLKINYVLPSGSYTVLDGTSITVEGNNMNSITANRPTNQLITNDNLNVTYHLTSQLNSYINGPFSMNGGVQLFLGLFDSNGVRIAIIGPNGYVYSNFNGPGAYTAANGFIPSSFELSHRSDGIYPFTNLRYSNPGQYNLKLSFYNGSFDIHISSIPVTFNQDAPCFNEGTEILILKDSKEEYVPIESLKRGDLVKSYKHGYRKIELIGKNQMVNNPGYFGQCMYEMKKTDSNGLTKDLLLTGWHSVLVDDLGDCKEENSKYVSGQLEDKYLLLASVSKDFTKVETSDVFTYYHFCLENDGDDNQRFGVYSNGILSETPSKAHYIHEMNLHTL
jgi:hypothetical protein